MTSPTTNKDSYTVRQSQKSMTFWKNQLVDAPERLIFQNYHVRTKIDISGDPGNKVHFTFSISKDCSKSLRSLSQQHDASLSAMLLSAFSVLLHRYTSQTDILVGYSTVDYNDKEGRLSESLGKIIPLRINLVKNPAFEVLLHRVHEAVVSAYEHKDVPPAVFESALSATERQSGEHLFQVVFAFRNTGVVETNNHIFSGGLDKGHPQKAASDLTLSLENSTSGIEAIFEYNEALFDADTIKAMAGHFQNLLNGTIVHPGQKIAYIPMLSNSERHKILFEWNDTQADYPQDKCIHQLFEEQVRLSPDAIAANLYDPGNGAGSAKNKQRLTYSELDKKANQLAHYLQSLGAGPEVLVGIYMKRSLEIAVALLGILKSGAAYLPLDPGLPKERLNFMLEDSGIGILLSQNQLLNNLPVYDKQVVCLDTDWKKIAACNVEAPHCGVNPENLAYVIYTSGSTGLPKGTLIIHSGVVNYLSWCMKAYRVADGTGCPVNSSLGFDATVTSFLSPLLAGKQLLLLPEENEIEALCNVLRSGVKYSLVKITPAHLEILNNLMPLHETDVQVNALVIGGDALARRSLVNWQKHHPSTRLINEYGPTETVVGCCVFEVSEQNAAFENIPIGKPIANTQIYILDKHLQPVPVGVLGEIFIGGAGVARGYLNRPELTRERFIANPFINNENARLYKTGDTACFLPDGNIMFFGRNDYQVKIRGYRIELGEIEMVLAQQPAVQQCAVMVREDQPGDKVLVAYIVIKPGHQVTTKEIRRSLGKKLPDYMVPSFILTLDDLPLTINGKVDRAALPAPVSQRPDTMQHFTGARNDLEMELTGLFEKALHISGIGIHDNVFDLGINSMVAYRLFAQVKKVTGIQLPLSILFQAPTIAELATHLKGREANVPWSALVPIQPRGSMSPLFLIHAGAGTVLFYRELCQYLGEGQPVYGLQPRGLDGKQKFDKSIEDMARHYIDEIRKVDPAGPYLLGGYCFGAVVAFEMAQQLVNQGYKVSLLANFNGVSPSYVHKNNNDAEVGNDKKPEPPTPDPGLYPRFSWQMLEKKSLGEKLRFLAGKVNNRIVRPGNYALRRIKYLSINSYITLVIQVYKGYRALGFKSWEPLRKYFFLAYNSEMVKAYKPRPYAGNITIFRSPEIYPDPHLGWGGFIKGNINTYDVPGFHKDRRQLMNEPFVQFTAEALKKYLDELLPEPGKVKN